MAWPDTRLTDLFGIALPIIQAPMAGSTGIEMAVAVAEACGLGSLPCAMLTPAQIREQITAFRSAATKPLNVNFFCHEPEPPDPERDRAWLAHLAPYFAEFGVTPPDLPLPSGRAPFGEAECALLEELRPEVVSFHFGLPAEPLLARVKAAGCKVICSATTLREAKHLAERGVDAIIAQGAEAGGHRGMFLEHDVFAQVGTLPLMRSIVNAVDLPVIAAGGIGDGPGIAAAFALGASAVQIGTAYLLCAEAYTPPLHRAALGDPSRATAITNVLSGRPARSVLNRFIREQGPINEAAPVFPFGRPAVAPLCAKAESEGSDDFSPLWSGQGPLPAAGLSAADLTRKLAAEAKDSAPR